MKSLLGGGALVLVMAAGAWSSDVVSGPDEPERPGPHHRQAQHQKAQHEKAGKPDGPTGRHPLGEPPGHTQRDRGGPPPWSGGPRDRSEEPPGTARSGQHG